MWVPLYYEDMGMKCHACGYEKTEKWDKDSHRFVNDIGDVPFIAIDGNFTITKRGNWHDYTDHVNLYACPKCGTIKTPIDEY